MSELAFQSKRPEAQAENVSQRKSMLQDNRGDGYSGMLADNRAAQRKPNNTGLPDNLKSGIESLSGMSMENVKVHYNSSKPAQLNAHAYAQGADIHLAPGQEKHLPHEVWHVVQQAQGRVKPTMQMKRGVPVNDDKGLEREADVMGQRALQKMEVRPHKDPSAQAASGNSAVPVQRLMKEMGVDKTTYMKMTMSTVYLYALFDGKPIGVFYTKSGKHAEENLIEYIEAKNLTNGDLTVYLSTSPCSSEFGTRDDGKSGCKEKLEGLSARKIAVTVYADHLYQPKNTGQMEREEGVPTGYSSMCSAYSSGFDIAFSKLPKSLMDQDMIDDVTGQPVAQLRTESVPMRRQIGWKK